MLAPSNAGRAGTRRRSEPARRRLAILILIALVALATLLVTAFGGGGSTSTLGGPASSSRLLPAGPPEVRPVASLGKLMIDLPINRQRITAVAYHASSDGALGLTPIGSQANQGLLKRLLNTVAGGSSDGPRWYLIHGGDGPSTSALNVGAAAGTDVYAPVSGTIVGIGDVILDGKIAARRVDIQPSDSPSVIISVSHIALDPSLVVGAMLTEARSKLGVVEDLSSFFTTQAISRYTNDVGNHVLIEAHTAATLDGP